MSRKILFLVLIFLFGNFYLFAQNQNRPVGSNFSGIGNAGVSLSDVWSIYHNQAGLTDLKGFSVGVHFENKYGIKELSHSALALALPTSRGVFGLSLSYFGFSQYNETKLGLAYALKLAENFSAGVQLDYFRTGVFGEYGRGGLLTAELGIIYEPIENLRIGAHAFNPVRSAYNTFDEEALSTALKLGASYYFSQEMLFSFEVESDFENTTNFKAGIEYQAIDNLFLRIGINSRPASYHFGVGYGFKTIHADIAFSHHQVLGYSSSVSLRYTLRGNEE